MFAPRTVQVMQNAKARWRTVPRGTVRSVLLWATVAAASATISSPQGAAALAVLAVPLAGLLLVRTSRSGCRGCGSRLEGREKRTSKVYPVADGGWEARHELSASCRECGYETKRTSRERITGRTAAQA